MNKLVIGLAIAMLVLHQDSWLWDNTSAVFGFIPVGLFYHACFSIAVAVLAILSIKYIWPHDLENWARSNDEDVKSKLQSNQYKIK